MTSIPRARRAWLVTPAPPQTLAIPHGYRHHASCEYALTIPSSTLPHGAPGRMATGLAAGGPAGRVAAGSTLQVGPGSPVCFPRFPREGYRGIEGGHALLVR